MSTTGKILNPSQTINGSYGEIFEVITPSPDEGVTPDVVEFMANIQGFEARTTVERKEVMRSGTRRIGYKRGSISGEGTLRGFKVTSRWVSEFSAEYDEDGTTSRYILDSLLEDPESLGSEKIRFHGVQVWELPVGWSVGDLIEEDIPFTFEDLEVLTPITGDPTLDSAVTGAPAGP